MYRKELNIQLLTKQLDEIAAYAEHTPDILSLAAPAVSKWGVSEHLDHLTKVLRTVFAMLLRHEEKPGGKMNLLGTVLLLTGFIPRGRGQSPAAVRGVPASRGDLHHAVEKCRGLLELIAARAEHSGAPVFPHPFFGHLNERQALRFLVVHNRHHFRILRDILTKAGMS